MENTVVANAAWVSQFTVYSSVFLSHILPFSHEVVSLHRRHNSRSYLFFWYIEQKRKGNEKNSDTTLYCSVGAGAVRTSSGSSCTLCCREPRGAITCPPRQSGVGGQKLPLIISPLLPLPGSDPFRCKCGCVGGAVAKRSPASHHLGSEMLSPPPTQKKTPKPTKKQGTLSAMGEGSGW